MKTIIFLAIFVLFCGSSAIAQSKSLDTAARQLKSLKADKQITLNHDAASGSGRIMYVAENFPNAEASRAGVEVLAARRLFSCSAPRCRFPTSYAVAGSAGEQDTAF